LKKILLFSLVFGRQLSVESVPLKYEVGELDFSLSIFCKMFDQGTCLSKLTHPRLFFILTNQSPDVGLNARHPEKKENNEPIYIHIALDYLYWLPMFAGVPLNHDVPTMKNKASLVNCISFYHENTGLYHFKNFLF